MTRTKRTFHRLMEYHVTIFQGRDGDWYTRTQAPNGRQIQDGSQGYSRRSGAIRAARRLVLVATEGRLVLKLED